MCVDGVEGPVRADCLQDRRSEKCALLGMPACLSAAGAQHQPPHIPSPAQPPPGWEGDDEADDDMDVEDEHLDHEEAAAAAPAHAAVAV